MDLFFCNIILMFGIVDSLLKVGGLMVMDVFKKQFFIFIFFPAKLSFHKLFCAKHYLWTYG
jgi:hypothetical protein